MDTYTHTHCVCVCVCYPSFIARLEPIIYKAIIMCTIYSGCLRLSVASSLGPRVKNYSDYFLNFKLKCYLRKRKMCLLAFLPIFFSMIPISISHTGCLSTANLHEKLKGLSDSVSIFGFPNIFVVHQVLCLCW